MTKGKILQQLLRLEKILDQDILEDLAKNTENLPADYWEHYKGKYHGFSFRFSHKISINYLSKGKHIYIIDIHSNNKLIMHLSLFPIIKKEQSQFRKKYKESYFLYTVDLSNSTESLKEGSLYIITKITKRIFHKLEKKVTLKEKQMQLNFV